MAVDPGRMPVLLLCSDISLSLLMVTVNVFIFYSSISVYLQYYKGSYQEIYLQNSYSFNIDLLLISLLNMMNGGIDVQIRTFSTSM